MSDLETLAAEYVLGTLDAHESENFERRLAAEREVQQAVAIWGERLVPLIHQFDPITPSPSVWNQIEAKLNVARGGVSSVAVDLAAVRQLRRNVSFWRGATAATGALAASLALFAIDRALLKIPAAGKSYVAVVNRGDDAPALIIRIDPASHAVYVRPIAAEASPGRSLELWYINAGESPKSMGVVQGTPLRLALPDDPTTHNATLAVTSELPGGSPTGGPTGPIVYSGHLFEE